MKRALSVGLSHSILLQKITNLPILYRQQMYCSWSVNIAKKTSIQPANPVSTANVVAEIYDFRTISSLGFPNNSVRDDKHETVVLEACRNINILAPSFFTHKMRNFKKKNCINRFRAHHKLELQFAPLSKLCGQL